MFLEGVAGQAGDRGVRVETPGIGVVSLAVIVSSERLALDECLGPSNGVIPVNVDMQVARMAREAIWDYGVDPKDAIHVATAMRFRDVRLSKVKLSAPTKCANT